MQTRKDTELTNEQFSMHNMQFKAACIAENIPSTKRQASKWRRKTGRAYTQLGRNKRRIVGEISDLKTEIYTESTKNSHDGDWAPDQSKIDQLQARLGAAEDLLRRLA